LNTKIIGLLMLVLLFATPALATIAVTWNLPAEGTSYNNNPMNAANIDLNFGVTDTNGANSHTHRVEVTVYDRNWDVIQTIVDDVNVREIDGTTDQNCLMVSKTSALSTYTCLLIWNMPENTTMGDGPYYIDANVTDLFAADGGDGNTVGDTNAFRTINIDTGIANLAAIRAMLLLISTIIVVGIIIVGLLSITQLNADPSKTAIAVVAAVVAVAIIAMILGLIVAMF